jgi:general stress protein YciG
MVVTVNEAGRRGGLAVLRNRGHDFYVDIGRRGQKVMRARYPNMAREWGKKGGRPRKSGLQEIMGEARNKRKEETDPPRTNLGSPAKV